MKFIDPLGNYVTPILAHCNDEQKTKILEALDKAEKLAIKAKKQLTDALNRSFIEGKVVVNSIYQKWFGGISSRSGIHPDSIRYIKVKHNVDRVRSSLQYSAISFDCCCLPKYRTAYGYVYPSDGILKIWLCDAFWSAPLNGRDSKCGTIFHELTHERANTTDHLPYGEAHALQLAKNDPDKAAENADSYEYFLEDNE